MSKRYSGKSRKDSSLMKKPKLSPKEKRKAKREKKNVLYNLFSLKLKIYHSAACFIESLTFPLSKPITLTFTSSPSFTTSVTLATLLSASSEI